MGRKALGWAGTGFLLLSWLGNSWLGSAHAQDIAVGFVHTCAINAVSGKTECWGSNRLGLLGANVQEEASLSPIASKTSVPMQHLDAGTFHQCGVGSDKRVYCWGDNSEGALGLGNTQSQPTPTLVPGLSDVASVTVGAAHTCALKLDDSLWCWGRNWDKQLGMDQPANQQPSPAQVPVLPGGGIVTVSAGFGHTCAIVEDGTIRCWGNNFSGQLGNAQSVGQSTPLPLLVNGIQGAAFALSTGAFHNCAIAGVGQVYCWGSNDTGQLGNGDIFNQTTAVPVPEITTATAVAAGGDHSCALAEGQVQCWGGNRYGQLGTGDFLDRRHPAPVSIPGTVIAIEAGYEHTCARTETNDIYCWGNNDRGEVGNGTRAAEISTTYIPLWGAIAIAGNDGHQCAIRESSGQRSVVCAGDDSFGQLGNGSKQQLTYPLVVSNLPLFIGDSVAVGARHSCAADGGLISCWGDNDFGQLGRGNFEPSAIPEPLPNVPNNMTTVIAGAEHTCALDTDGKVWCWGSNEFGAVGVPQNTPDTNSRKLVALGAPATALAAGTHHTCAVLDIGTVKCWGNNDSGQLGIGNNNDSAIFEPLQVVQLSGVTQISAGASHTCARKDNGDVVCWGRNDIGQLGTPDVLENPFIPNLVPGIPPMKSIASGSIFNCALTMDGKRWCWGDTVGDEGLEAEAPHLIETPYTIMSISAGGSHVCDIVGDFVYREVHCTGDNQRGQLGNDHAGAWAIPQRITANGIFSDEFEVE